MDWCRLTVITASRSSKNAEDKRFHVTQNLQQNVKIRRVSNSEWNSSSTTWCITNSRCISN